VSQICIFTLDPFTSITLVLKSNPIVEVIDSSKTLSVNRKSSELLPTSTKLCEVLHRERETETERERGREGERERERERKREREERLDAQT
jgi:hypothetical protein